MKRRFLLLIPALFLATACTDKHEGDVFAQLQSEMRFDRDVQFIYLYGSVLRALIAKAQDPAVQALANDTTLGSGLGDYSGMMDNMERVRIFRATDWEDEQEKEYRERIYSALVAQGNELLMGTSIRGGEMTMFIHDDNSNIDRFQLLIQMPSGGEAIDTSDAGMLGNLVGSWTGEKSLMLIEVMGSFDKDSLGRMLMQLNTSLTE